VSLELSSSDNQLVSSIASQMKALGKPVIVVVQTVGPMVLPWAEDVDSIVSVFMAGQEHGTAITRVLFGEVNPSGKLPVTFPKTEDQVGLEPIQYPGINLETVYEEELLIGYRRYNAKGLEPLFPFGHGLSYTDFKYANMQLQVGLPGELLVTFDAANVGSLPGFAVPQVYVTFPDAADEPPVQLKGFSKVGLLPGESKPVIVSVSIDNLSVWLEKWVFVEGEYQFSVADSSRDIRLTTEVQLPLSPTY